MALTTSQQASKLFKKLMGVTESATTREFYEEGIQGRQAVMPSQVWKDASSIPQAAFKVFAAAADGEMSGVVMVRKGKTMTQVPGAANSFYHADLKNAIPFNFGDGVSYRYSITDSLGNPIPFGMGEWLVDTDAGTITFYGSTPSNMPPVMSWYQYCGGFGVGEIQNERERSCDLAFSSAASFSIGAALPAGAVISKISVKVSVAFNGTAPSLSIGSAGGLMGEIEVDLSRVGMYVSDSHDEGYSGLQVPASYSADGSTVGAANILVEFSIKA